MMPCRKYIILDSDKRKVFMSNNEIAGNLWNLIEKILRHIVYKILHINLSEKVWSNFMQFVRFGIVGLSNTVISYMIYVISLIICQRLYVPDSIDYLIATVISFVLSVLWSFYWNSKFVFELDGGVGTVIKALLKTYVSYSFTGLFLSAALQVLWVEIVGLPKLITPIINLLISVPINYLLNKFWAFKNKEDAQD